MRAKDVISPNILPDPLQPMRSVDSDMPLLEVLPRLLDAPGRRLEVSHDGNLMGVIDEISLLEGLGRLIAERDDSSIITIECDPSQYSASVIAHAVEDADIHLVDLISHPADGGKLNVMLRVRALDPSAAISSLERHGYQIVDSLPLSDAQSALLNERLASLQALINV